MTAPISTASTTGTAPRPRSRLRARIVVATLAAIGFAALAWASFVSPLPRLTYNPSDSVAVGWYRIDPFDPRTASLPRPLPVDSIVLVPLPATAAGLAAQRVYLPVRVPLLKRVGAVAPQHVCIVAGQVRIDGVPVAAVLPADRLGRALPSLPLCRRLEPGELFLLSVQCERIRAALRVVSGAAVQCAGVLPRTCLACGHRRVRRRAGCKQHSAAGPPMPGATAKGKGGRQDKRTRHRAASKACLHMGGTQP